MIITKRHWNEAIGAAYESSTDLSVNAEVKIRRCKK